MTERTKRSAADLLLELLDKVPDAATLEVLLEPQNLLLLLRAQGGTDDAIRRDLSRRAPGELLLEVLAREPDTAALLRLLGNPPPRAGQGFAPVRPLAPQSPDAARKGAHPLIALIVGALLAAPSGWYLFVRLDVLRVPGLIRYFPGAYALLAALLLTGLGLVVIGLRGLLRGKRAGA
jgi:hypothetical protein